MICNHGGSPNFGGGRERDRPLGGGRGYEQGENGGENYLWSAIDDAQSWSDGAVACAESAPRHATLLGNKREVIDLAHLAIAISSSVRYANCHSTVAWAFNVLRCNREYASSYAVSAFLREDHRFFDRD